MFVGDRTTVSTSLASAAAVVGSHRVWSVSLQWDDLRQIGTVSSLSGLTKNYKGKATHTVEKCRYKQVPITPSINTVM